MKAVATKHLAMPTPPDKMSPAARKIAASLVEIHHAIRTGDHTALTVRDVQVSAPGEYDAKAVRALRKKLGVSQRVFAQLVGVSDELAQGWEQGVRTPHPVARRLLDRIAADPEGYLRDLIHRHPAAQPDATAKARAPRERRVG
ncbi:MAG: higA-2 [Phycisphaerales bacterium]|nr:higA-2 [Phycisphaerales bacterium]